MRLIITGTAMFVRVYCMRPEATDEERDAPWLALAESPPRTTPTSLVAVLPAERLPLQLYLDSVTSGLSVEGTVVHESELRAVASWRRGDPVDPLRHARAGVSGWQVAFSTTAARSCLCSRFTASTNLFDEFVMILSVSSWRLRRNP
ncbi:MAG: hypothetical protein R2856_00265 [Caldilineaceae bacterium]